MDMLIPSSVSASGIGMNTSAQVPSSTASPSLFAGLLMQVANGESANSASTAAAVPLLIHRFDVNELEQQQTAETDLSDSGVSPDQPLLIQDETNTQGHEEAGLNPGEWIEDTSFITVPVPPFGQLAANDTAIPETVNIAESAANKQQGAQIQPEAVVQRRSVVSGERLASGASVVPASSGSGSAESANANADLNSARLFRADQAPRFVKDIAPTTYSPLMMSVQRGGNKIAHTADSLLNETGMLRSAGEPAPVVSPQALPFQAPSMMNHTNLSPGLQYLTNPVVDLSALIAETSTGEGETADQPVMSVSGLVNSRFIGAAAQSGESPVPVPMRAGEFAQGMFRFVIRNLDPAQGQTYSEARIVLHPEHLGKVDVRLTLHNGQLAAQFMADTAMGKEMLEQQIMQLRTSLQSHGIQVEKLEVSHSGTSAGLFQEHRHQQPGQRQESKQNKTKITIDYEDLSSAQAIDLNTQTIIGELGSGRSFHATA